MKFDESKQSGKHGNLEKYVGEWSGTTKTWFEPDVLGDESPMSGRFRSVLGGRFLLYEYSGAMGGKSFEGAAIFGFDLATNKYQAAWVDSFHMSTGMMFSEGETGDKFSVFGDYFAGENERRWGWRTELEAIDSDNIVITAYNISPDGESSKATETQYSRVE